ncbi:hypothetical protein LZ32DRAFT_171607 [Colletotrichum eremochloae]|nr:hypothetical protein LZ32DRAFT_171607 [Colletotrichum eremochloae]
MSTYHPPSPSASGRDTPSFLSLIIPDKITQTRWLHSTAHALQPCLRLSTNTPFCCLELFCQPSQGRYLSGRVTWSDKSPKTAPLMGPSPVARVANKPPAFCGLETPISSQWSTSINALLTPPPPLDFGPSPLIALFHHFPITFAVFFFPVSHHGRRMARFCTL